MSFRTRCQQQSTWPLDLRTKSLPTLYLFFLHTNCVYYFCVCVFDGIGLRRTNGQCACRTCALKRVETVSSLALSFYSLPSNKNKVFFCALRLYQSFIILKILVILVSKINPTQKNFICKRQIFFFSSHGDRAEKDHEEGRRRRQ